MEMRTTALAVLAGILATCVEPVVAQALPSPGLSTLNYVRFYSATDPSVFYACENTDGSPCSGSTLVPGTNWTLNYFAQSSAAYGILRGQTSANLTGDDTLGPFPSFASVGGRASFRDSIAVSGGSGQGTVVLGFHVTGTASATAGQSGRPQFQYVPVLNGALDYTNQVGYAINATGDVSVPVPFTFGVPTEFQIDFYALSQIVDWVLGASASADYFHTALLTKIVVQDSTGAPLTTFSIASASGTEYSTNGVVKGIAIDIQPRRHHRRGHGTLPIAILSSAAFDALEDVDRTSLTFGPTGHEPTLVGCEPCRHHRPYEAHHRGPGRHAPAEDVNGDGLPDLICHFDIHGAGFQRGQKVGVLRGWTTDGVPFQGADSLRWIWGRHDRWRENDTRENDTEE